MSLKHTSSTNTNAIPLNTHPDDILVDNLIVKELFGNGLLSLV